MWSPRHSKSRRRFAGLILLLTAPLILGGLASGGANADARSANLLLPTLPTVPVPTVPVPTVPVPTIPVPTSIPPTLQPTVVLPTVGVTLPTIAPTIQPTVGLNPTSVAAGVGTAVNLCGPVTAYVSPTAVGTGSITIAGQTLQLAPGASFSGGGVTVGSNLCVTVSLNAGGQVSNGTVSVNANTALHICGPVTALTSPTNGSTGSVTIGGQTLQLAPGATLSGTQLALGSTYCLDATTNPQAQIANGSVTASAPTSLNLCGLVDGYTAPTTVSAGSLTIAGQTIVLAPGTTLNGAGVTVGNNLCANFTTDPQGQVTGGSITASAPTTLNLCGVVNAFTAPTSVSAGSITIGGQTLILAPSTVLQGGSAEVGTTLCGAFSTNPQGQISGGTVTVQVPTSVNLCGVVTAFVPSTAVTPGSITIGGTTVVLPAGFIPSTGILVGQSTCIQAPGPGGTPTATPPGNGGTATPNPTAISGSGGTPGPGTPGPGTPGPGTAGVGTPGPGTPGSNGTAGPGGTPYAAGRGTLRMYALPHGAAPWHLEWDARHNLWFTEINRGRLGELLAGTHTLREFALSSPGSRPHALAVDRRGNIWVGESAGNRIDELTLMGSRARLTQWLLPHPKSNPEGITVSRDGMVWIAEGANRLARLNPRTGRLDEYATTAKGHPHDIEMATSGPIVVNEDANTAVWVHLLQNHVARLTRRTMPSKGAHPTHLVITQSGIRVAEQAGNAVASLDGTPGRTHVVRPHTYKLSARVVTRRAVQTGLPVVQYRVTPRLYRVKVRKGSHWTEWKLPHQNSQPYDVRITRGAKRIWVTETRGNCVGVLMPARNRILEYKLPQKNSRPIGLQIRTLKHSTQVWIAASGIDRLALLTTP